jgi:hypothetical protein
VDDAGNALATWTYCDFSSSNHREFVCHVFFSRRYALTGGWTSPQIVQNDALANASDVNLAVEPNGIAWAVWAETTFKDPSFYANDRYAIFAAKFDPAVGWGAAEEITGDVKWTIAARIRTDGQGNPRVIIAWTPTYGNESMLWAARRSAGGTWGPLETLAVRSKAELSNYDLSVDANDDAVATWCERISAHGVIRSRHFTVLGGWEPPVELSSRGGMLQLAKDNAGNAFAVWQEESDETGVAIWTARFEKSKGWMRPQSISSAAPFGDDSTSPKLAFDTAGNAVAVWRKYVSSLKQTVVRANYYSKTKGWGTDDTISTGAGQSWPPELAVSRTGYAIAVWWQQGVNNLQPWSATRAPTP